MKTFILLRFKFAVVVLIALFTMQAHAQDPSSILDLESTSQGLLSPRMTSAQRTAIATPAQGLMVYDTNTKSFWYYKDSAWNELGGGASPWLPNGAGINYNAGGVGIGTLPLSSSPSLNVVGEILLAQPGIRSFSMPGWAPTPTKQVISGVFTGEGINAPVIRYYAPNGNFSDTGVDTLGNYLVKTDDNTKMTVLQNGKVGIGTTANATNPAYPVVVESDDVTFGGGVITSKFTHLGNQDRAALYGESTPADGYGYGVYGTGGYMGVRGIVPTTVYTGSAYGGHFHSGGTAGDRYGVLGSATNQGGTTAFGVFGTATGATNNWAGYFDAGNVYVANDLRVGTTNGATGYKLSVNGKIACEEVLVDLDGDWPDYVFTSDYELKTLEQVKQHIAEKGHLPGVPSAQEVADDGLSLGEMNKVLMEKVEELTLYILQQEEKINSQEKQFEARLSVLESLIK